MVRGKLNPSCDKAPRAMLADSISICYICSMSTVTEIKEAIDHLSPQERCELEALLHPRVDDDWDCQMISDAEPGGKLDRLREASIKNARAGKLKAFPTPAR
jgi:hypothetical protein